MTKKAFVLLHLDARPHFRAPGAPATETVPASSPSLLPALGSPMRPEGTRKGCRAHTPNPPTSSMPSLARLKLAYDENEQTNHYLFKAPENGPKGQRQRDICLRKPAKLQEWMPEFVVPEPRAPAPPPPRSVGQRCRPASPQPGTQGPLSSRPLAFPILSPAICCRGQDPSARI